MKSVLKGGLYGLFLAVVMVLLLLGFAFAIPVAVLTKISETISRALATVARAGERISGLGR